MASLNMKAPQGEGAERVRVGVLLTAIQEENDCVVLGGGGHCVTYQPGKNEEAKSFVFDQVATADDTQSFHLELLQRLTESIASGYNGALLLCGAFTEQTSTLVDGSIIKQVLVNLFHRISSQVKSELFITVSFLQFHPDGSAVDLLNLNRQNLKCVTHPILGTVVEGACEVCVTSAEEAFSLYETCRETLKANAGSNYSRCSSLFSLAAQWKLHPEEEEEEEEEELELCSSRLQLFSLAGGASRTDLRGVSPLVKVVEQSQHEATASPNIHQPPNLLHFLLNNALTGNSRTVLIYWIHPPGLLDDETPAALALAQKARSFVTNAKAIHWCPRMTEQKIRDNIAELIAMMMSQTGNEVDNTYRLAELTQNLQMVKSRSWEKQRQKSEKIKEKLKRRRLPDSTWSSSDDRDAADTVKCLKGCLKQEMEEHIREGKGAGEQVQKRVARIQQLREALREETLKNGTVPEKRDPCDQSQLLYREAEERRRRLKEDCERLIQEEVEKMERDLAQEPTEGPQRELLVLTRERQVLVLQLEALRAEAQQTQRDLQCQYRRHQTELQQLREETMQVFRDFREVTEERRKMSEGRYSSVLLEAVQDAVYLSAQNQQLQADNKLLHKALAEIKDALAARGDPKAKLFPENNENCYKIFTHQ